MILVTGGTGLVGSHLMFQLIKNGNTVRALIRTSQSKEKVRKVFSYYASDPDALLNRINWIIGDVTNAPSLFEAFKGVSFVYHCAAAISFDSKDSRHLKEVNVRGTANVVEYCLKAGVKKLLHVSSIAAIGNPAEGNLYTEDSGFPQGKISAYAHTKTQSELEVWRGMAEGLDAVIVNPSVILGPGHWQTGSGRLFSQVLSGMKFYTRGTTGFVDVRNVVKTMISLMESDIRSERFIINEGNYNYERVFQLIAKHLKVQPPKYYASPLLTSIAWRIEKMLSVLFGKKATLTHQSAKAAHLIQKYSSEKLQKRLNFKYTSIEESIDHCSKLLIGESNKYKQ